MGHFQFNESNFEDVFNQYWRKLFVIAFNRVKDSELAKDLVQEVFEYCWKQKDTISINTSLEAYLRTALQYQIIAHFRRIDTSKRAFEQLYMWMVYFEENTHEFLSEQDLARTLNTEIDKMPITMREVYKLRIKDYSVNEIADQLNIAEKTVRNNLSLGLQKLKEAIINDYPAICIALYILLT
jgi:RNA polymerase sigma factor (sigma-70 family)